MRYFKPPLPKDHGSWVMFAVPLLLGLVIAPAWSWPVLLLIVAALGFFLIRYPLALLVKTRKRPNADRPYLWQWTFIYGAITILNGVWLVFVYRLWWVGLMGLWGSLLLLFHLWLVSRRQEMSVIGELAGIFGLTLGAPMAYYTASGQLNGAVAVLWMVNVLYFGGTVFYIKLKVRQQPRQPAPAHLSERLIKAKACLAYQTVALTLLILMVTLYQVPLLIPLALAPATLKMLWGAWQWQDKKSLSLARLGVIEIFHALAFTVLVAVAFGVELS